MNKKFIYAALGMVLGAVTALLLVSVLSFEAACALGVLVWAISWWIFKILPDFVTALIMGILFVMLANVPMSTMFSAFSNPTWWLLLSAFGLSIGVTKSGLMYRISLYVLKLFPPTYRGQVLGLLTVGTVTAPFIPSLSAKAAMLAPLSQGISCSMGYGERSKPSAGLFLAMLTGLRNPAPLFISASVLGFAFLSAYPESVQMQFTMGKWFLSAAVWFVVVSILNYIALGFMFKPMYEARDSRADFEKKLRAIGHMSKSEKKMLWIILITMILWITERFHGIPSHIAAIAALCATIIFGVVEPKQLRADMNWESLIFIGVVLGLAPSFAYLGINDWIVSSCGPAVTAMASNLYILLPGVAAITVLARFVIVSELAFVNIFMVFIVPLAVGVGINPWVVGFSVYCFVNPWFFLYQNPVYMAAYYSTDGSMIGESSAAKYCAAYLVLCLIALVVSIPVWQFTGIAYL